MQKCQTFSAFLSSDAAPSFLFFLSAIIDFSFSWALHITEFHELSHTFRLNINNWRQLFQLICRQLNWCQFLKKLRSLKLFATINIDHWNKSMHEILRLYKWNCVIQNMESVLTPSFFFFFSTIFSRFLRCFFDKMRVTCFCSGFLIFVSRFFDGKTSAFDWSKPYSSCTPSSLI